MSKAQVSVSKVVIQQTQNKYFIGSLNTLVGQAIVELLRNDNENDINPHIIVGTLNQNELADCPRGVKAIIDPSNLTLLSRVCMDSDAVIYDISKSPIDEIEFILKILKYGEFTKTKTFILISSPLTWSATPLKERKNEAFIDRIDDEFEIEQEMRQFTNRYSRHYDTDLHLRRCPRRYELWKDLEMKVLSSARAQLRTYVICPGIVYGNGEEVFFPLFKKAWTNPTHELPILAEGLNVLPLIHTKDLAVYVKKAIDLQPSQQYIFAVDGSILTTQKRIIQSISQNVGGGYIKYISLHEGSTMYDSTIYEYLTLNLWFRPTQVFGDVDMDIVEAAKIIQYHSSEGFIKNSRLIRDEFQSYRGLQTVKTVLLGPSFSGKSYYGQVLAQKYQIPHIQIEPLIQEVIKNGGELGDKVKTTLQNVKDRMIEEALVIFEAEKKKKKVPKGQAEPEFDSSKIQPRLPEDLLIEIYKWRLEQNDAQNQGYILDGFPKTADQVKALFNKKVIKEDQQNQIILEIQQYIVPKSVVIIESTDDSLKEQIKQFFSQEDLLQSKYNDDQLAKKLQRYRTNIQSVTDAFKELKIETKFITARGNEKSIIDFIERDGQIMVLQEELQIQEEDIQAIRQDFTEEILKQEEIKEQEQQQKQPIQTRLNNTKGSQRGEQKSDGPSISRLGKGYKVDESKKVIDEETRNEQIRQQEREILDTRSQPLRQYLADNVVPFITEGLIELCKEMPNNPILFLAEFLEAKSNEVQIQHVPF